MKNNYFIIHGSFSSPYENWFEWLQKEIRLKGDDVYVPTFPVGIGYQNYENWSKLLKYYCDLGLINKDTTIIGHSIAPVFICKFLIENELKIKKIISVCGFNNCLGVSDEYDEVNKSMYLDNISKIKKYAKEIICIFSNNDPYVSYNFEKSFADEIATKQLEIKDAGHINSESGFKKLYEIKQFI